MNFRVVLALLLILGTAVNATSDTSRALARLRSRMTASARPASSSEQQAQGSLDPDDTVTDPDRKLKILKSKASSSSHVGTKRQPRDQQSVPGADNASQPSRNAPFPECLQSNRADEVIDMKVEASNGQSLVAYCAAPRVIRRLYQVCTACRVRLRQDSSCDTLVR